MMHTVTVVQSGPITNSRDSLNRRRRYVLWLCALLLVGLALRLRALDEVPFWVDEAESSINALTILQEGLPLDHYLGLPIYENTLVRPWRDSPEYEFKDISYSRNGLALYHGWLPLYSLALAFRVFGVHPDHLGALSPQYNERQRVDRTRVARLPSVVFGLLLCIGLYLAGASFHSRNAGMIAALMSTFLALHISFSQQARYYAATLAVSSFCAWSIARMAQRGKWRDFLTGGALLGLLFHTQLLSFAIMGAVCAVALLPSAVRRTLPTFARIVAFSAVLCAFCVPWLRATDFLHEKTGIPAAWGLMTFPRDLVVRRVIVSQYGLILVVGLSLLLIASLPLRWPATESLKRVLGPHRGTFALFFFWSLAAYFGFLFLIPAASFAIGRLVLIMIVPTTLLIASLLCSCAEALSERLSLPLAITAAVVFIIASNRLQPNPFEGGGRFPWHDVNSAVDYLQHADIKRSTRVYATSNDHLVLTFYTGMPIQSIAPVRKSYLDSYPGGVILFEKAALSPTPPIEPCSLIRSAALQHRELTAADAEVLSCEIASFSWRKTMVTTVEETRPLVRPVPQFALKAWEEHERMMKVGEEDRVTLTSRLPIFNGMRIRTSSDWRNGFFYRFVNPGWRKAHPNYHDRMRNAVVTTLPCSNWAVFFSPSRIPVRRERIGF